MGEVTFRYAEEKDVSKILFFINELAVYEKMQDDVVATEELLREWIFEKKKAEVIFAVVDGIEVGSCLDWNKPSIDFYLSSGAAPMEEWTVYRFTGETLHKMAEQ